MVLATLSNLKQEGIKLNQGPICLLPSYRKIQEGRTIDQSDETHIVQCGHMEETSPVFDPNPFNTTHLFEAAYIKRVSEYEDVLLSSMTCARFHIVKAMEKATVETYAQSFDGIRKITFRISRVIDTASIGKFWTVGARMVFGAVDQDKIVRAELIDIRQDPRAPETDYVMSINYDEVDNFFMYIPEDELEETVFKVSPDPESTGYKKLIRVFRISRLRETTTSTMSTPQSRIIAAILGAFDVHSSNEDAPEAVTIPYEEGNVSLNTKQCITMQRLKNGEELVAQQAPAATGKSLVLAAATRSAFLRDREGVILLTASTNLAVRNVLDMFLRVSNGLDGLGIVWLQSLIAEQRLSTVAQSVCNIVLLSSSKKSSTTEQRNWIRTLGLSLTHT